MLEDFLRYMACPICGDTLMRSAAGCECGQKHSFPLTSNIISFSNKTVEDKYDDPGLASRYVKYSFGAEIYGQGAVPDGRSEALYRTVSSISYGELIRRGLEAPIVVDLACGAGRVARDIADVHRAAVVFGFDLSTVMAQTAAKICSGNPVPCGADEDGWPVVPFVRPKLNNVFIAQADACHLPLRTVSAGGAGADIVLSNMLIDRLYRVQDVERSLAHGADLVAPGGIMIVTSPFNWITAETWHKYGKSRTWVLERLNQLGLDIEIAFDMLPYRECLDPFGTSLELPVLTCVGRKNA